MCYEAPGPRCSGHTRTNFRKAKENLVKANADLKVKQEALKVAQTAEAVTALEASQKAHKMAVAELNVATAKYDASKLYRAEAMDVYRKARDEYNASPEGIKKNRIRSADASLSEEQRETARQEAVEGNATRNRQKEAYEFKKALDEAQLKEKQEAKVSPEEQIAALTRDVDNDPSLDDWDKRWGRERIIKKLAAESSDLAVLDHLATGLDNHWSQISKNPHASAGVLEKLRTEPGGYNNPELATYLAQHPNVSKDTLNAIWKHQESNLDGHRTGHQVKRAVAALASNPNTPPETLSKMNRMGMWGMYGTELGSNPSLTREDMENIIWHDEGKVAVASNSKAPAELLREISKTRKQSVYTALTSNPATPRDVLEKIARSKGNDSWLEVAHKAQERLRG